MQTITPTPEQIDALAFELHTMGVQVPPRDTAFFQAAVRKWLASLTGEWVDPRPKYPDSGAVVMVRRANGREEKMTCEKTWAGRRWKSWPNGYGDSIAHPEIVGWRNLRRDES